MINITFKPNTYELEITGHAGHGVKGKDIVCAAVSTLFYTLGQALAEDEEMLMEELVFKDKEGHGYIKGVPEPMYLPDIERIYNTIFVGFKMLARQYPDNISFNVKIEG